MPPSATPPKNPLPTATQGPKQALGAVADAYVDTQQPATHFGAASYLVTQVNASGATHAYLMFHVEGLTGAPHSAILTLDIYDPSAGSVSVVQTSTSYRHAAQLWTDYGLNAGNAPQPIWPALDLLDAAPKGRLSFDVTDAISGSGTYSFALVGHSADAVGAYSREVRGYAPRLDITP